MLSQEPWVPVLERVQVELCAMAPLPTKKHGISSEIACNQVSDAAGHRHCRTRCIEGSHGSFQHTSHMHFAMLSHVLLCSLAKSSRGM
jgi:hypothetical protein